MPQSIILTGLDLVRSKQEADPGSLSDCQNFEITNVRGLTQIEGIKSYSGGSANGVVDPYVFHNIAGKHGLNLGIGSNAFVIDGYPVSWGDGDFYNASTGELTTSDGDGIVCFVRTPPATATGVVFAVANIRGRFPAIGDTMVIDGSAYTLSDRPYLASEIIAAGDTDIFGSFTDTVDSISDLIEQLDVHLAVSHHDYAMPTAVSPNGRIAGGMYFKDEPYFIGDIEARAFTSGSAEPSEGDTLYVYYTGTAPTGSYNSFTVEKVVTESGDWNAGTAAGVIHLVLDTEVTGPYSSVKVPTDCRNNTTAVNDPMTVGALVRSTLAGVWKERAPTLALPTDRWTRVDLGHEVRFSAGDNYPTVLNRANRDAALEATVTTTAWMTCGTASGWTSSSNAQGATDGSVATQSNDSVVRPGLTAADFGFNLPSTAVVLGVRMRFTRRKAAGAGFITCRDRGVRLVGVPGISQDKKRAGAWPTSLTVSSEYGSISDLWNTGISASIVNDPGFGVIIEAEAVNGGEGVAREIDSVEISVTYKDRSSVVYFGDASTTAITSITHDGVSTATVTTTAAHGFVTGDSVTHAGAVQTEYNITATITVTSLTMYTYTVPGTPVTPATGTKTAFRDHSTARVIWYHKEKGDWGTDDAQGTMTLYEVSAPSAIRTGQVIRTVAGGAGVTIATTGSGAEKVYAPPSGALDTNASQWVFTDEVNFFGAAGTEQVFGASGADFAVSYDGTYWIRIRTGADANQDKPTHVAKFGDQLVLGFPQGVCIASDLGYGESFAGVVGGTLGGSSPISDDTVTYVFAGGAQEIKLGDTVHGLLNLSDQNLAVGCKNSIRMLVGSGGALVPKRLGGSSGIIPYTLQDIGIPVFIDYRGVGTLSATDAFGDFARGRLSDSVSPWLIPRLQTTGASFISNSGPIKSFVVRNKNQLRTAFRDGYQLTMTMVGNDFSNPQFTIQKLPFVPAMVTVGVTSGGKDLLFMAPYGMAETGASANTLKAEYEADTDIVPDANLYAPAFFYQGDVGTSWDGKLPIDGWVEINGGAAGREWEVKHYDKMIVHGQCYGFAPFGARFAVNFEPIGSGTPQNVNGGSTSGTGNLAFELRPFSKVEKVRTSVGSDGYALTIQFVSSGDSLYGATSTQTAPYKFRPFTIQSIILISETLKTRPPYAGS